MQQIFFAFIALVVGAIVFVGVVTKLDSLTAYFVGVGTGLFLRFICRSNLLGHSSFSRRQRHLRARRSHY